VVEIDPTSLQLATPACPVTRKEVYIAGTEPTEFCELHGGRMLTQTPPASWLSRIFGEKKSEEAPPPGSPGGTIAPGTLPAISTANPAPPGAPSAAADEDDKKSGLLHKIFGIFGGKKQDEQNPKENNPDSPH
jgi:hypothetical protein